MATLRSSFLRLKLIGEPLWDVEELVGPAAAAADGDKIVIGFNASFTLPPSDNPAYAARTRGAFSAPLRALAAGAGRDLAAEREAKDMIDRMLEAVRLPIIAPVVDHILDGASRMATASAGGLRRINFNIDMVLHQMPSILLLDSEENEELQGRITDINVMLNDSEHNERVFVVVQRVLPHSLYQLSYQEREWIIRTDILPYFEFDDDGCDDDQVMHINLLSDPELDDDAFGDDAFGDDELHDESTVGPSFLRLKLIGEPSWGVEEYFEDHAGEPGDSKIFIGFYASFSLPPLDDPAHVVFTQGVFSAPLHALMAAGQDLEAEREARDMIDRMLEEVRLPIIPSVVDHILDRVSRLDEPSQTATAAGALWMIFYIDVALHQMPSILLEEEEEYDEEYEEEYEEEEEEYDEEEEEYDEEYEEEEEEYDEEEEYEEEEEYDEEYEDEEEEEVTDISDLLNSEHNKRVIVVVHRVFPDHLYHLSYEQRELIIRTEILPHFEFYDDGYDEDQADLEPADVEYEDEYGAVDPDFDDLYYGRTDFDDEGFVIRFMPASEESIEGRFEQLRIGGVVENQPTITCSVCCDEIPAGTEAIRLPCWHHFHGDCIVQWLETSEFCPVCRFEKWLSS